MPTLDRIAAIARRAAALAGAALALGFSGHAYADVKDGVDAWSAGDFARAVAEWTGPAEAGDPDALFNLGQAYRLGRGVDPDIGKAREFYARAMQKGHVKAADNYGLLLFQLGEKELAMPHIRAASDRGDPRAQYILGLTHFNGDHSGKDWVRAYALLTLSQAQGLPQAGEALAQMDRYVPAEQRQLAQGLARRMEEDAARRRATELAALDLAPATGPEKAAVLAEAAAPEPASPAAPPPTRAKSEWKVQLGAFGVAGNAERLWARLSGKPALAGTDRLLLKSGKLTRLLASGFTSRADAQSACAALKKQGQGCLVTKG